MREDRHANDGSMARKVSKTHYCTWCMVCMVVFRCISFSTTPGWCCCFSCLSVCRYGSNEQKAEGDLSRVSRCFSFLYIVLKTCRTYVHSQFDAVCTCGRKHDRVFFTFVVDVQILMVLLHLPVEPYYSLLLLSDEG